MGAERTGSLNCHHSSPTHFPPGPPTACQNRSVQLLSRVPTTASVVTSPLPSPPAPPPAWREPAAIATDQNLGQRWRDIGPCRPDIAFTSKVHSRQLWISMRGEEKKGSASYTIDIRPPLRWLVSGIRCALTGARESWAFFCSPLVNILFRLVWLVRAQRSCVCKLMLLHVAVQSPCKASWAFSVAKPARN